eukprot:1669804-Prymnesium_polylepis.1
MRARVHLAGAERMGRRVEARGPLDDEELSPLRSRHILRRHARVEKRPQEHSHPGQERPERERH